MSDTFVGFTKLIPQDENPRRKTNRLFTRKSRATHNLSQTQLDSKTKNKKVLYRFLMLFIVFLSLLLIAELVYQFLIVPQIRLRRINLTSELDMSLEKIMEIGNINLGDLYHQINVDEIRNNLLEYPSIRSATVEKTFPDKLWIQLTEREALAIIMVDHNGIVLPVLVDSEGVLFRAGFDIDDWQLPIIQGLHIDTLTLGSKVDPRYWTALMDIQSLQNEDANIIPAFSEFYLDEVYKGVFEWILIPVHLDIRIRASLGLDSEKIIYVLKILDRLKSNELADIREIDFRTGDIVYSVQENAHASQ